MLQQDTEGLFDAFINRVKDFKKDATTDISTYIHKALYPKYIAPVQEFKPKKVLVLGSGGLTIGQAGEFDYSGVSCCMCCAAVTARARLAGDEGAEGGGHPHDPHQPQHCHRADHEGPGR